MWKELFEEFNCTIIVMNEMEDDDKRIFDDIISLLHYFATKMCSKKRKFEIIEEDLKRRMRFFDDFWNAKNVVEVQKIVIGNSIGFVIR